MTGSRRRTQNGMLPCPVCRGTNINGGVIKGGKIVASFEEILTMMDKNLLNFDLSKCCVIVFIDCDH